MQCTGRDFHDKLLHWYDRNRRDLPWRPPPDAKPGARPDPYHVLVSEAMLQQTQVATVVPYFRRFIAAYPSLEALANADEQQVLRLWQGLGYYSRARNLLRTAKIVQEKFDNKLPSTAHALLDLPGIGRYTAGAIASIAFDERAPILDGNVKRVLCRLDCIREDPRRPEVDRRLWARAEEILPLRRIGDFNSALMELGATVCTPQSPKCLFCPLQAQCQAFAAGCADQIPPPKQAIDRPLLRRWTFCIARANRWLIEQRPAAGRWAGLWQFITRPASTTPPTADTVTSLLGLKVEALRPIGQIAHGLTHRRYELQVFATRTSGRTAAPASECPQRWVTLDELPDYPLPRPHVRIAEMLRQ